MSAETIPTVFFPEIEDPTISALRDAHLGDSDIGVHLLFGEPGTSLQDAAERLKAGEFNVLIAGAAHGSPDVLRAAIHHVGAPEKFVSSFFAMEADGQEPLFFADCAVHVTPDPNDLVKIAYQTCESVQDLGYEPVVAFLSLSTLGSADHLAGVQQIRQAVEKFKQKHPEILAYGELQVDAAMNPDIFKKKTVGKGIELVEGKMPNVFIFPDGQSGNIAYKLVEQLAGRTAVGPMLNGVSHDMHDLSRGGTVQAALRAAQLGGQLFLARQARRKNQASQ